MEAEKKDLETTNLNFQRKFQIIEKELKESKNDAQRMRLRTQRGAPYFQILEEFFQKDLPKFVDENHTCNAISVIKKSIKLYR